MPTVTAVLDTCVLVPAVLRDTLLRAAEAGIYHARWSNMILEELERTLIRTTMVTEDQARWLIGEMARSFANARVSGFEHLIDQIRNDPKDRHVVAAAVVASADVIVTENLRHFPASTLSEYRLEAESPDTFLVRLYDANPVAMITVIHEQSAGLNKPPGTVADVLDRLMRIAPRFVELIRHDLS